MARDQTIRRTLEAFGGGPYRVLVTTGMSEAGSLSEPPDAQPPPYVPHAGVLTDAVLTIAHTGHGTPSASPAHGVPILILPDPAADQPRLARQLAALGAGIALDGETSGVAETRAAAEAVLTIPSHAAAARRPAQSTAASPGTAGTAAMIEHPIRRRA